MTTLILGCRGQLGTAFRRLLPDAVSWSREHADLSRSETLREAVRHAKPDVVLNCAAYNAVDQAERDAASAFGVNALAVRELALACRDVGATLVHFSTNYVYGLETARAAPYAEADAPGPISAYGVSKLTGEYFVRSICPMHLVIRTCGVFGPIDHPTAPWNFIEKLLARARQGEKLRVVNDQIGTPTAAADLAEGALNLLRAGACGLRHFTNAGACSWHEFALAVLRLAGIDRPIEAVSSGAVQALARRPAYSVLDCAAYDRLGLTPRRRWQEALEQYLEPNSINSDRASSGG